MVNKFPFFINILPSNNTVLCLDKSVVIINTVFLIVSLYCLPDGIIACHSYARGYFNKESDIDILINFSDRINGFDYIMIAHELEDTFHTKIYLVSRKGIQLKYLPFV